MTINVTLVVVGGDVKTTEIKPRLPAILGRGRGATILLPHPLVSRQHCELYEANGQLMVKDLGSLNGTYVGQDKIAECILAPDSLLTVGSVTFRAVYEMNGTSVPLGEGVGHGASDTAVGIEMLGSTETPPEPTLDGTETVRQPTSVEAAGEPEVVMPTFEEIEEAEEKADEEDDFQSFLRGLEGK